MTEPTITFTHDEALLLYRLAVTTNYRGHDEQRIMLRLARWLDEQAFPFNGDCVGRAVIEWYGTNDADPEMDFDETVRLSARYLRKMVKP
jgi:hypothetical protein